MLIFSLATTASVHRENQHFGHQHIVKIRDNENHTGMHVFRFCTLETESDNLPFLDNQHMTEPHVNLLHNCRKLFLFETIDVSLHGIC